MHIEKKKLPKGMSYPYPAIVSIKSNNIEEAADDFLGLTGSLYQLGYILYSPREIRFSYTHENQIDLIVTFIDEEHSESWLADPFIIKHYQTKLSKLTEPPKVIFYPDAVFEYDNEQNCTCKSWPFMLLSPEPFTKLSPITCGKCLNHILLDKIPDGLQFEEWSAVHDHIYEIWLSSGLLEKWAEKQLGKYNSALNKDVLKIIKRVKKKNGIPIYYQLWQETYNDKNSCPSCKGKGVKTKLNKPKYACKHCHVAFGY